MIYILIIIIGIIFIYFFNGLLGLKKKTVDNFTNKYYKHRYPIVKKEFDAYLNTWYPNTWLDVPKYNLYDSYANIHGVDYELVDHKTVDISKDNIKKNMNMNGYLYADDVDDKTIQEIYDNCFISEKEMVGIKIDKTNFKGQYPLPKGNFNYIDSNDLSKQTDIDGLIINDVYSYDNKNYTTMEKAYKQPLSEYV